MSHLSGQSAATTASAIDVTDTSTVGGPTVKDSLDTLDAEKAPLASPALTGVPTVPTAAAATSTTQAASTEFVTTADDLKADLASPTFTGVPAVPTADPGTNTTQAASTAFTTAAVTAGVAYTPADETDWADPNPTTMAAAIDRLAAAVAVLLLGEVP